MHKKILILGIGNILYRDEGIGSHIIKELKKITLPSNIEVVDGGVVSLDILLSLEKIDKLIIIDAIKLGKTPGTIYKLKYKDLTPEIELKNLSLHQLNLLDALSLAKNIGMLPPEVLILGVEPQKVRMGLNLSPKVKEKIPHLIEEILKECSLPIELNT